MPSFRTPYNVSISSFQLVQKLEQQIDFIKRNVNNLPKKDKERAINLINNFGNCSGYITERQAALITDVYKRAQNQPTSRAQLLAKCRQDAI